MGIKYKSVAHGLDAFVIRAVNIERTEAYKAFVKADALRLSNRFRESIKHYLCALMMDRNNYRVYKGLGISYKAEKEYVFDARICLDDLSVSTEFEPVSTAFVGERVSVPQVTAFGGSERGLKTETSVIHMASMTERTVANGYFTPDVSGDYAIRYSVSDYLGNRRDFDRMISVSRGTKPIAAFVEDEDFIKALKKLIAAVGLKDLRLSEWGIKADEAEKLAANSFEAMGALYDLDPVKLNAGDAAEIIAGAIR